MKQAGWKPWENGGGTSQLQKRTKRKIAFGALLLAALLAGCSSSYKEAAAPPVEMETEGAGRMISLADPESEAAPQTGSQIQERVAADGKIPSYLTGLPTDLSIAERRPIAIMISNDKEAQPHYGINRAGVIYEAPAEGGMNRYMAILEDYDDLERIGSVRSCRTYYTFFCREFEGICAHFGQSDFAKDYLNQIDHLDGISGKGSVAYFRSSDRKSPHNAYASGQGLRKAIEAMGISEEYPKEYEGHYQFAREDMPVTLEDGFAAQVIKPGYVNNAPWFEYHADDGLYYRFQRGAPENGEDGQIAVKNVIFQYCSYKYYGNSPYLDIDVFNNRGGYYFTNGRGELISWKRDGADAVTKYYNMDGEEIVLNPGKTWICIIQDDQMDKAEYYGEAQ